jgi:hypothetical protein
MWMNKKFVYQVGNNKKAKIINRAGWEILFPDNLYLLGFYNVTVSPFSG